MSMCKVAESCLVFWSENYPQAKIEVKTIPQINLELDLPDKFVMMT